MAFITRTIFLLLFYFAITKFTLLSAISIIDEFHEELVLRPLDGDHVYAYFQFTTLWSKTLENNVFKHSHLFPRSLGELIERYDVGELHISMTQGTWRHKAWGYPIVESSLGSELWAWFLSGTTDVDKRWRELTNSLSGLLGCSLNFVDNVNSVNPMLSFRPTMFNGIRNDTRIEPFSLRYANLPREIVCTENLTPWKKLLPCDSYMGLASLLNARYMHNSNYHSISLSYKPTCLDDKCGQTGVKVVQTISLVYDVLLLKGSVKSWSIRKLYGSGLSGPCPISKSALLYVDITSNKRNAFELSITPDKVIEEKYGDESMILAMFNMTHVKPKTMFNIIATYHSNNPHLAPAIYSPILWTERYIRGYGRDESLLITKIYNNSSRPLTVIYLENLPWYIPVYYHTLKITSNSEIIYPSKKYYYPGKSRGRPYYLEVMFDVQAYSLTEITIEFDYVFLKWQEYPPDANHGFYVGSGVLSIFPHSSSTNETRCFLLNDRWKSISDNDCVLRMRTVPLIINLPTPDFSMPYNVICLACTVVALAFGPLHNITTKRLHKAQAGKKRGLVKLVIMLWRLIKRFSKRNKQ